MSQSPCGYAKKAEEPAELRAREDDAWFIVLRQPSHRRVWRNERIAEKWVKSAGARNALVMNLPAKDWFFMVAPRWLLAGLSEALRVAASSEVSRALAYSYFSEDLAEEVAEMRDVSLGPDFLLGVHPWCFEDFTLWHLEGRGEGGGRVLSALHKRFPDLEAVLIRGTDYLPLGGDRVTAQMLVEALNMVDAKDQMAVVRDSLARWLDFNEVKAKSHDEEG
jgi:hypothetical protein